MLSVLDLFRPRRRLLVGSRVHAPPHVMLNLG